MTDPVRAIADAVLYEGYLLWPYRRSALKNQRRWTFGGVFPARHSRAHPDDRWRMRTECLVEGDPAVDVTVRFLHVVRRDVVVRGERVDAAEVDGRRHLAWDEAVERELAGAGAIDVPAGRAEEELSGDVALLRSWEPLRGSVAVACERVGDRVHRIAVEIANTTPFAGDREAALRRTLCSTHTILRATAGGRFISQTDPPAALRAAAEACRNEGTWPVLAGEPGSRDVVLSSPIILEDHPRVAPESPGDLFDGGEIDQMLVLNLLTLTDAERAEVLETDPRARELLERTEALSHAERQALHGAIREFAVRDA